MPQKQDIPDENRIYFCFRLKLSLNFCLSSVCCSIVLSQCKPQKKYHLKYEHYVFSQMKISDYFLL